MKKLMTLMLGLSLIMGSVAVTFARQGDSGKKQSTRGGGRNKKGSTTKGDKTGN